MTRRRFTKNQIHQILEQYEEGASIQSLIKEFKISQATFYNWKAKYGSSALNDPLEVKRLKEDNERLKRMFADISLENLKLKIQLKKLKEN